MAKAFSSNEEAVLQRTVEVPLSEVKLLTDDELIEQYELKYCCQWISARKLSQVALQFPDSLLCDSARVASYIKDQIDKATIFILADTSYGSCCIDTVAAQHYNADGVIHFGHCCLSGTQGRMEVLSVFCKQPIDVSHCCTELASLMTDQDKYIVLLADVAYQHTLGNVERELATKYRHVTQSMLNVDTTTTISTQLDQHENKSLRRYTYFKRTFYLPMDVELSDCVVFYVGPESMTLTNWMMTLSKTVFYSYNPKQRTARLETANVNRMLSKRFFLIEKAKDARIVGILAGTLGNTDYLSIISRLKESIKAAGKKYYTFSMGKLNVAKLANFSEVDIYVLVSCPESTLLDVSEYYQPIVTPFEMDIACNANREWTGEFVTDYRDLLPDGAAYVPLSEEGAAEADVSLVTGKIRRMGLDEEHDINKQVSVLHGNVVTAKDLLSERSWRGLEVGSNDDTPVQTAKEGRSGIAMSYTHEAQPDNT